jgi:hypothetical protein
MLRKNNQAGFNIVLPNSTQYVSKGNNYRFLLLSRGMPSF